MSSRPKPSSYALLRIFPSSLATCNLGEMRFCIGRASGALVLLLLSIVITIPWLGAKDFYSRGEPREALVAQSMLRSGNWVLGQGYGGAVPSKPPFTHWVAALASLPFGEVSEFTARLPSALAYIALGVYLFLFLEGRTGVKHAFLSAFLLLTCAEWARAGMTARVDAVLSALLSIALFELYRWHERKLAGIPFIPIVLLAAATLTKGPVALVLPAAIFGGYLLISGVGIASAVRAGLAAFVPAFLIAAIWYVAAYLERGDAFASKVGYENVLRFLSSTEDEPHKHSIPYLVVTLLLGFMPWTLLFVVPVFSRIRKLSGFKLKRIKGNNLTTFLLLGIAAFLVFFSIPASKRSVYLLPIYPNLAVLAGTFVLTLRAKESSGVLKTGGVIALLFAVVAILGVILNVEMLALLGIEGGKLEQARYYSTLIRSALLSLPGVLSLAAAGLAVYSCFFRHSDKDRAGTVLLAFVAMLLLSLNARFLPVFANDISGKSISKEVSLYVSQAPRLLSFNYEFYAISFYLQRRIDRAEDQQVRSGDMIFVFEKDLENLKQKLPAGVVLERVARSTSGVERAFRHLLLMRVSGAA